MNGVLLLILEILPSLIVGIFLAYFNHIQNERHEKFEKKSDLRKKEGRIILDVVRANAKMGYANSMAILRGKPNGEVEKAVDAYTEAMNEYDEFIKENYIAYMDDNK